MALSVWDQLQETVHWLKNRFTEQPRIGVVLGSGLGNFTAGLDIIDEVAYTEIPHFPVSTVEGHSGKLILARLGGKIVLAMAGRFHFYEGYSTEQVTYPIRVMKLLGIEVLLLSNAAGGCNPDFKVGDLMIIRDHISFATVNPLLGKNIDQLGPRFPDMSEPYKKSLIEKARKLAKAEGIELKEGVYFGVTGPTFETRAEYKLINILGGDAVGMSTVQEVIVANHMQLPVFAMSVITDIGIREEENTITHEEVLAAAKEAEGRFTTLFIKLIEAI